MLKEIFWIVNTSSIVVYVSRLLIGFFLTFFFPQMVNWTF